MGALNRHANQILSETGISPFRIHNFRMKRDQRYVSLRSALTKARKTRGLTQTELAERLQRPQSFVSKFESGERRLDVIEFLEVCEALDVRAASLLKEFGVNGNK